MAAFKKVQWQRCLISAATCGRLKFPPCIESDGAADAEDENVNNATLTSSPSQDSAELAALELELARRGVEAINSLQPVPLFAVVCGDLVHAFPTKQAKEQERAEKAKAEELKGKNEVAAEKKAKAAARDEEARATAAGMTDAASPKLP